MLLKVAKRVNLLYCTLKNCVIITHTTSISGNFFFAMADPEVAAVAV